MTDFLRTVCGSCFDIFLHFFHIVYDIFFLQERREHRLSVSIAAANPYPPPHIRRKGDDRLSGYAPKRAQRPEPRTRLRRHGRLWASLTLIGLLLAPLLAACTLEPIPRLPRAYPYAADDGTPNLDLFDDRYRTVRISKEELDPEEKEWRSRLEQLDFEQEYDNIEAFTEQSVYPVDFDEIVCIVRNNNSGKAFYVWERGFIEKAVNGEWIRLERLAERPDMQWFIVGWTGQINAEFSPDYEPPPPDCAIVTVPRTYLLGSEIISHYAEPFTPGAYRIAIYVGREIVYAPFELTAATPST